MTGLLLDHSKIGEEALELIWENTNDAIFLIGQDGAILHANPTFTDILGWGIQEIRGLTPPPALHNMTKEQHDAFLNKLREGENINYSLIKRRSKDGEILDILATYRSINKGEILAVGMYKDFTEQMEIQRQLEESEVCYRKLVEFLPEAIIVQNKHHIVFANPAGVKFLGQENTKYIIGRSIWGFFDAENKESIELLLIDMIKNSDGEKPIPIVERLVRFDKKEIFVEITAIPMVYNGESVMQILFKDITDRKIYEIELENMAYHDPLTGLKNRRSFTQLLERSIESASEKGEQLALLYMDLDKFKEINDSLGHEMGDELLKQFANRLINSLRGNSVISRIGGDEFLILLKDNMDLQSVKKIAFRLYKTLQQPYQIKGQLIKTTASVGISIFPMDGSNSDMLIDHADQALYLAKETRNQLKFYS
ncbi:diguanylate cyclase domain-containing protein [Neobacillus sp. SAB-20_R2A]|uniref:diguanylate cyclase domain-containing protein n=1 Tax=Neobacillus sp. SAB-20_R2A TaxID=3120519 RepID=UPI003C6DCF87